MDSRNYRKIFKEISEGFSSYFIGEERRYIKHQSFHDVVDFDDIYDMHLERAQKKGLPTEAEIFEELKKDEVWTEKDDAEIEKQSFYVDSLIKNKKNIYLKSALDQINKQITEAEEKLSRIQSKKQDLVSNSADKYALSRANDFYIVNSFYKDKGLQEKLYSEKEFEYASTTEVSNLVVTYNEFHKAFSDNNIKHLAIQDFYKSYYSFIENLTDFFGKPVVELTNFQLNLTLYTKIYKNIFEQYSEDIPERIKNDPDGLLDFANSSESREKIKQEISKDSGASTIVGATKEDMDELGLSQPKQGRTLEDLAKEKGGSLSMKDLMNLSGA